MLAREAARSLHASCHNMVNPQRLGRTLARSLPPSSSRPLLPRSSFLPFQSRPYVKNRHKKPSPNSPPTQPPNGRNTLGAQPSVEPTTIPAASRAAIASEGGLNGTELPEELPDISKLQNEYEQIARARIDGQNLSGISNGQTHHESETSLPPDKHTIHQVTSSAAIGPADAQRQSPDHQQSTEHLPDLTQGIPSTLDAELAQSSAKSHPESLNITEQPTESNGKGGGDLPKSAYISSFERRRNRFANYFYAFTLFAAISGAVVLGRNWESAEEEEKHKDAPNGWGLGLFYNRASARLAGMLDYYNEPAFPKLLPNTDPAWERPYTLVLSLEDMLVHSEWDREHGWRMAKRPGVDYFLRYLSQYYELVIFTSVPSMIGQPIISKLDPYHIVMWPLFREATRYKKGEYIKVKYCVARMLRFASSRCLRIFHS